MIALDSHRVNLAKLIDKALRHLPSPTTERATLLLNKPDGSLDRRRKPDFVAVTRGPGMRSNLSTGLDTAKGLSVAWQIPLVGIHHMQGHLLTPRLVSALHTGTSGALSPEFPFLSVLVSGGHTMLVHSESLSEHTILGSTIDIAIGDALDKIARSILPETVITKAESTMYGKVLENFAFPNGPRDFANYQAPSTRGAEIPKKKHSEYSWEFALPLVDNRSVQFSFSGLISTLQRMLEQRRSQRMTSEQDGKEFLSYEERVALSRVLMEVCFEHLGSKIIVALEKTSNRRDIPPVRSLVISGGVAANQFLRAVIRSFLDIRGFSDVQVIAPPPRLCTDNAAMIGWAGIEMFESGYRSDLGCLALKKWCLDSNSDGGGLFGPDDPGRES